MSAPQKPSDAIPGVPPGRELGASDGSAVCSLCGEAQHRMAECPACLGADNTRRLLLTTRKALANLLATCPHEYEGQQRARAALIARKTLDILKQPNDQDQRPSLARFAESPGSTPKKGGT
jgi:hypothetical protein